jgi:flagellar basal-body rod protein FlgF
MKARMESLDMLANNLANTGTTGFKADREFYSLYQEAIPMIQRQWTDFSQGTLMPTGNPLNLALSGKGFFSLNSPAGVVYTRNGDFRISKSNQLETSEGFTLRNTIDQGRPITVDPQAAITIDRQGAVFQAGQQRGQMEIAAVDQASVSLRKQGNSYYAIDAEGIQAAPAEAVEVRQGTLEQSNTPVADGAVRLISVMRQFEMLQRALTMGAEMNKRAVEDVARV